MQRGETLLRNTIKGTWLPSVVASVFAYGALCFLLSTTSNAKGINVHRRIKKIFHKERFKKFSWDKQLTYVDRIMSQKLRETYTAIMVNQAEKRFAHGALRFVKQSNLLLLKNFRDDASQSITTRALATKYRRLNKKYGLAGFKPPRILLAPMVKLYGSGGGLGEISKHIYLSLGGFLELAQGRIRSIDHERRHYGTSLLKDKSPYNITVESHFNFAFKDKSLQKDYSKWFSLDEIIAYGRSGIRRDWHYAKDFRDQTKIIYETLRQLKRDNKSGSDRRLTGEASIVEAGDENRIQMTVKGDLAADLKTNEASWLRLSGPYNKRVALKIKDDHGGDATSYFLSVVGDVLDDSKIMLIRKSRVVRRKHHKILKGTPHTSEPTL